MNENELTTSEQTSTERDDTLIRVSGMEAEYLHHIVEAQLIDMLPADKQLEWLYSMVDLARKLDGVNHA